MQLDFCPNCFVNTTEDTCPSCGFHISSMEESTLVLRPGTFIAGRYKVGRVLGIGGFGITYTCFDIRSNTRYAVKEYMPKDVALRQSNGEIRPTSDKDKEVYTKGLEQFLYETNLLITLSGVRGIVNAKDFIVENNTGYLIMEYLDGVTVKALLNNRGTLDCEFAINILLELAVALREVHAQGLLHRDISPDNIMILKDHSIKLIDFGAARFFVGERSKSLSLILKPGFAPPEQYSSSNKQGPWTDIYALAATFYKMVTGATLPDALCRTTKDTVERLDKNYVSINSHVGKAIQKALALNYNDRYQTVDQFVRDLKFKEEIERLQNTHVQAGGNTSASQTKKQRFGGFTSWLLGKTEPSPPPAPVEPVQAPPEKKPYIRIVSGSTTLGVWDIEPGRKIAVGRDSGACDITIPSASVSRKHCSVSFDSSLKMFRVIDSSSNGTYLANGTRLAYLTSYTLASGAVVMLSSPDFIMEMGMR